MKMTAPTSPTSRFRLSCNKKFRLTILLSLVALGATVLASTNSSARSLGQKFFARAAAIVSGSREANVASMNRSLASAEAVPQTPGSTMATARRGHTTTRLSDGRVLIAGGDNAGGGYLSEAEIFDPANSTFTTVGSMAIGRSDHAAVKLSDGRVLLIGGRTATGTTNTVEVFDPAAGTFTSGSAMSVARAGHTATLLADGRVFVAGGDANGSAEIFDSGSFSVSGSLTTARAKHSAALLLDGRVLIVGGRDTNGSDLSSMEIFDPADGSFSNAGDITLARVLPHLRVLFDGKVQIIGGNNDESMEIYDAVAGQLGAYAHVLPATDTCTLLRPGIMASETRAALFHNGQSDVLLDRSGHTISELPRSNQAFVVGGANSGGVVLDSTSVLASSPASITTDKLDYTPGETVNISGRGFQAGETVRLKIHEDPHTPQERGFDIVADANGSFVGTYLVQDYDLRMKFIVSARGLTSGWNAQTTFTDGNVTLHLAAGQGVTQVTVAYQIFGTAGGGGGGVVNNTCSGSPSSSGTLILNAGGTVNIPGFGNNNLSVRLGAVTIVTPLNSGRAFDKWTSGNTTTDSGIDLPGTPTPCISANPGAGTNGNVTDAYAHFKIVNAAPTAAGQSVTTNEDTPKLITLSGTDPDGNNLTFSIVSNPANGTLGTIGAVSCTGTPSTCTADVTYTPNANYNGPDSFTFKVNDGTVDSNTATVSITVTSVNDTPDAVDDIATVDEDSANNAINVLANDTDADNATPPLNAGLTVIAVTQGAHGSVSFTAGGVSYTPNANYFGSDSFTYTISDNGTNDAGHTDTATVNVTINNINDTPDAVNDSATVDEDTTNNAVNVLANDTDADNLTPPLKAGLTVIAVTQGAHGSVSFTAGGVSYTPAPNYFGSDSFTYTISDNGTNDAGHTDTATVNVTINNINDAPDAVNDSATVDEDTTNNAVNVLANDTDADNLTPPLNAGLTVIAVTQGAHGSVSFTAGGVSYTPAPNYFGSDSFTYTISDNGTNDAGHTDTATVNVTINNINDAPDAINDNATVDEDTTNNAVNVLANDTDADNLTPPLNANLTVIAVTQGAHGSVSFTAGGVSYTPAPNYFGSDSFTYTISDNGTSDAGHTDTATVNVTINNINDAPDAINDNATVDEDTTNNAVNVLANDTDADNLTPPLNANLTVIAVTQGTHGSVSFTAGGVSYTPAANYFGSDSFTYTISDNGTSDAGHTDTATVNVTINNINDTPDAVDDNATVTEDSTNNVINVLANDTDADNLTPPANADLTVIAVTQGTHGTVTFTPTGVSYTPNANYFGSDSFTYTISDNGTSDAGHTDTATVNVTINNVNDTPDAVDDSATVAEDSTNNAINVLANDTDADNLTPPFNTGLTVIAVTQGAHGTVTIAGGGVSYTPASNYFGPDTFTYTISDDGSNTAGHTDTATVHVTVTNVNDAPVMNTFTIAPGAINENDSAVVNGSFSDADGIDAHTVVISWGDSSPNTTLNLAAGVLTFTANHQYKDDNPTNTAADVNTVTATVCDGGADGNTSTDGDDACANQNTTITVNNLAPIISSANGPAMPQPAGSTITVTANFTDVGTQDAHLCSVNWDDGSTTNGTVAEVNGSGTCTASHTYASPGVYSVVVTITDDDTGSASRPIDLQFIVVFDPNAGFVTGGGWIMSPVGACQLTPGCATATGKANFGFVSKYKKGSTTPDGQTEFQFQAGDINFHSSAYDAGSLVVSGYKAQYRGTGDINGVPGYKFVLTAYDGNVNGGGGVDKFRIKITKNGTVVYDNRLGASDDIDLADPLAISGGSIVIHK